MYGQYKFDLVVFILKTKTQRDGEMGRVDLGRIRGKSAGQNYIVYFQIINKNIFKIHFNLEFQSRRISLDKNAE